MHRGPLSASLLATYGLRLADALDPRSPWGIVELADLVAALPAGCAFWQATGGPLAWSDTQHMLARLEYRMRELLRQGAGNRGQRPEPMKPPPFAAEAESESKRVSEAQRRFEARFG